MSRVYYPACRAILRVILDGHGSADSDSEPLDIPVLPKAATIHKNSYRQADSYELTFDAGDLPFDPRIVRSGAAEIYLFQTDGQEGVGRVLSRREPLSEPDAGALRPRGIADTVALDVGLSASRDRFTYQNKPLVAGLFDRTSLEMSSDGKGVTISGQDYTAHLASLQWKPEPNGRARPVPIGKRLDLMLADVLAEADPTGDIAIDVRGIDATRLPIVGKGDVRGSARGIPVEQNTTYWDVIYKTAQRCGFITFVDGLDVVLTLPKTIDEATTSFKVLTWGKNLESLSLERELGKVQAPTIVIRGYDEQTRQTISVEYPPGQQPFQRDLVKNQTKVRGTQRRATTTEKHRAKAATKKGRTTTTLRQRDEYEIHDVKGVTDRATLEQIAESRYRQVGTGERRCVAKTRDLRDMRESDMLNVVAGDAVIVQWDEFNRELLMNPGIPDATKVQHLIDRGFNSQVAQAVVRHSAIADGLDRPLRVKETTYDYDVDEGIGIEIDLQDFVVLDGFRGSTGAPQPTRAERRSALVKQDGTPLGGTPEERAALIGRHR